MAKKIYICRKIAILLVVLVLNQTLFPAVAYCLTSGPSQPEFSGFQQAGVTDMVDLFSGDFMYNIPLADVDGFPINMSYNANPRMDDEASWVGLGWSLNPGSISRNMRGIPDDFAGEGVTKKTSMANDVTVGIDGAVNAEIFGFSKAFALSIGVGGALSYNTRRGFDFTTSLFFNPIAKIGDSNKALSTNIGLSSSSQNGLNMDVSLGLGSVDDNQFKSSANLSAGLNSRQGLKSFTFQTPLPIKDPFLSGLASHMGAGSITHNFGPFSYTPTSSLPLSNESISFSGKGGGEIFGLHPNFKLGGFFSRQYLAYNTENQVSYGYLYLEDGQDNDQALLDYNAEVSGQIKENTPNLPLAYGTYDVFSVAGHGIGGAFRAVRNDVGLFRPAAELNTSSSGNIGIELGGGNAVHGGGDIFVSTSNSTRGGWTDPASPLTSNLKFRESNPNYRNFYFKFSNDNSKFSNEVYNDYGKEKALYLSHEKSGSELIPKSKWLGHQGGSFQLTGEVKNENNTVTNSAVRYLTGAEAAEVGLDRQIMDYPDPNAGYVYGNCNPSGALTPDPINRVSANAPAHHLSEFTVFQGDGSRYVYGLPVKNIRQVDATFSAAKDGGEDQDEGDFGLVKYDANGSDAENSTGNNEGREEYFESNEMPSYAHSFLLTSMLSADYVDKTGDGITDDDLGNAVKINYHLHDDNFKWRIPFGRDTAQYHGGYNSDDNDDKASYVYGEKELWYVHSIESRTKVAQFFTSPREDGYGVAGENGGIGLSETVLKLDSIQIFTKSELKNNNSNPVPLKTVHFNYEYTLCKGVPNRTNFGGKLTLTDIHFTYQNSDRGALNPYVFSYKETSNDNYLMGVYNRWGYPQKNPDGSGSTPKYPHVQEFPYVLQDGDEVASENAGVWSLEEITLPTGATINVTYEPDDYAYVQNKRAGQMMRVVGFTNDASANPGGISNAIYEGTTSKKFVVVDLPVPITSGNETELMQRYFEDVGDIYFDMKIEMTNNDNNFERIKGYFSIDTQEDIVLHTSNNRVSIPVEYLDDSRGRPIHPIAFAGFQVLRIQLPEVIYPHMNTNNPGIAFFKSIFNAGKEIRKLFKGFEFVAMKKKWARTIDNDGHASWIRLANPNFKKLGGNSRVQKVTISDNWTFDGPNGGSTYGQRYEYTTDKEINGVLTEISSGVAAYEPAAGGEENLMKQPLPYAQKYLLGPKNLFYSEAPFGESLFPAPSIGYSKVKVTNIANDNVNLIRTQSGYSITEYFTAKDFPTKVTTSQVLPRRVKTNPILKFLKIQNKELVSMSQGYTIELNDMHGKQRRTSTYDKNEQLLSSTTYKYQLKAGSGETKWLDNEVKLVKEDGTVTTQDMGVEFDLWQETFKERNVTEGNGTKLSGDFFMAFIFPVIVPTAFPNSNKEETGLSAAVTTKVIHRNGILKTVEVIQDGSQIATENVAYDEKTGNVLINKTFNEHDDPIYSFTTPAYWAYPYMGHASNNLNTVMEGINITDGLVSDSEASNKLRAGDELQVTINGTIQNDRVYAVRPETATQFTLVDRDGAPYTSTESVDLKVIRSGNRNMIGNSVQQTQTLADPLASGQIPNSGVTAGVLSASASTYKSDFPIECETTQDPVLRYPIKGINNPYVEGGLGQWRPYQTFSPKKMRGSNGAFTSISSSVNQGLYGTYDGVLNNYFSGWTYDSVAKRWVCQLDTWILGEEVSKYDKNGNALESFNALCIPTAAHFGYKNSLPTIIASNTTYAELYGENFEEYIFEEDCDDADYRKHLEIFTNSNQAITVNNLNSDHAHTGLHSLEIPANQTYYSSVALAPCDKPGSTSSGGSLTSDTNDDPARAAEEEALPGEELAAGTDPAAPSSETPDNPQSRLANSQNPPNPFIKICGTQYEETFGDVVNTPDGGYLAVGTHTDNPGASPSLEQEAVLVKMDASGQTVWAKTYGGNTSNEAGYSIVPTSDGNYFITGSTNRVLSTRNDVFIMKVTPNGDKIWENSFEGSNSNLPFSTVFSTGIQTSDGGYLIGARTQNFTSDVNDNYIIKVNANGLLQWSKHFGYPDESGNQTDSVADIIETSDGNYVFVSTFRGQYDGGYNSLHDIGIVKLDTNGDILWQQAFGTGDNIDNGCQHVLELPNGNLVVSGFAGTNTGFGPANANALELILDANGNKVVARGYNSVDARFFRFLSATNTSNGVTFAGWYNQTANANDYDGFLYNSSAGISEVFSHNYSDRLREMTPTTDGGYLLSGSYQDSPTDDTEFYVVKADANGEVSGTCPSTDFTVTLDQTYPQPLYTYTLVEGDVNVSDTTLNMVVTNLSINCSTDCGCDNNASFTYSPTPVCEDMDITFTNTSTGATTYEWYVDGTLISTSTNFVYSFPREGVYTVTLNAYTPGCDPSVATEEIGVFGADPVGPESITIATECNTCREHLATQVYTVGDAEANPIVPPAYRSTCDGCLPLFTPKVGEEYLVSAWVANDGSIANNSEINNAEIEVTLSDGSTTVESFTLTPEGPVIEGWQRISGKIAVSDANGTISQFNINFRNTATQTDELFVDDIRIHPNICNAKSYVYDPYSARLMAELDENNYALFYEYDDEGLLVRIKRETEKGIVTIQEGRTVTKPNPQ